MAKFKVLKEYKDKKLNKVVKAGEEIEITVKRADEINEALKSFDGPFVERVEEPKEKKWSKW